MVSTKWLLGLFLLASPALAGPGALPPPTLPAPFGVNIHFTKPVPGEMERLSRAFRVARMDFVWDSTERSRGVYDFSAYDGLVRDLEAAGVLPYFIFDYGNNLYQQGPPRTPEARAAYARWAAAAVRHFRGHKILWEFWNEPNGNGFWGGKANAGEYARLVNDAGAAVRKADRNATVLVGALSGFDWAYINTMVGAGNLRWADAFSVHPYRSGFPESAGQEYSRLRRILNAGSPGREIPILCGEWGYSTNTKSGISEERQAQYLARQRLFNLRCGVGLSIWYDWKDDGPNPEENEHRFGSVRQDLRPKPSYLAAATSARVLDGYRFDRMLVDEPNAYVMLLRNGQGETALALWTTGPEKTFRVPGRIERLVSMTGAAEPVPDGEDREIGYGPSPKYALLGRNAQMEARAAWRWLAPGALLSAGRAVRTTFTLANTTSQRRHFDVALGVEGGDVRPAKLSVELDPGRSREIPVTVSLWNRAAESVLSVKVASGGEAPVDDSARIPVAISNPIAASMNATEAGRVNVGIEAPDAPGRRSKETVSVEVTNAEGHAVATRDVTLDPASGRRASVAIPVPATKGASRTYGVKVKDASGHVIATLAPVESHVVFPFDTEAAAGTPRGLSISGEGDPNVGGSATLSIVRDPVRGPVADVQADFPDGWRYFVVHTTSPAIPDNVRAMGLWVNGDNSGDYIRTSFMDAKGQVYQTTYGPINWTGWKWITMRLDDPTVGSWGGPQDGIIHRPIRWQAVFLLDSASQKAHKTHVQFDDITELTGSGQ